MSNAEKTEGAPEGRIRDVNSPNSANKGLEKGSPLKHLKDQMLKDGDIRESATKFKPPNPKAEANKKKFYEPEGEEVNLEVEIEGTKKPTYPLR
jgi:hypothetical protein